MTPTIPSQLPRWLLNVLAKLFQHLKKSSGRLLLNRISVILWAIIRRIWNKIYSRDLRRPCTDESNVGTNQELNVQSTNLNTIMPTGPVYASYIPPTHPPSPPNNPTFLPLPTTSTPPNSGSVSGSPRQSLMSLDDTRQRRPRGLDLPGLNLSATNLSANHRQSYHGRDASPHPSQRSAVSNTSRFSWHVHSPLDEPAPRSRASSRSRIPHVGRPRDQRVLPDPHKDTTSIAGRASPGFPRSTDDLPNSHSGATYLEAHSPAGVDIRLDPASPQPDSSGGQSVLEDAPLPRLRDVNRFFVAISPDQLIRYNRRMKVPERGATTIEPMTFEFEHRTLPHGWTRYIHPEGANCFYHPVNRIWTDTDLYSEEYRIPTENFVRQYEDTIRTYGTVFPPETDMVIDVYIYEGNGEGDPFAGQWMCGYYFVNHKQKIVFYLDPFDTEDIELYNDAPAIVRPSHLRLCIEYLYWFHTTMFPMCRDAYAGEDLAICRGILVHLWNAEHPLLLIAQPDCETYLKMTDYLRIDHAANRTRTITNSSWAINRIMSDITHTRFMNYYGEAAVRLDRGQSICAHGRTTHTWLTTFMRPILFKAPDAYLSMIEQAYVDGMIHTNSWKEFILKMNSEWQENTLFATVLLNANVGFLTIDSIQAGDHNDRTPAQLVSYLSTIVSIGSIIIGLLLIRMNRDRAGKDADAAIIFIQKQAHVTLGLEVLAMLYSMPFALLMMVLFLAAFSLMCFSNTPTSVIGSVSSIWVVVLVLIIWALYVPWARDDKHISPLTKLFKDITAGIGSEGAADVVQEKDGASTEGPVTVSDGAPSAVERTRGLSTPKKFSWAWALNWVAKRVGTRDSDRSTV
ncbi:hypothetical protein DL96DRAFT_1708500 [Flagelloscypha sp. PMI_526]|nr:hypothetical protein DL96DRAFT_1708500 [Flagelloscypha sp. PMI_526]